MVLVLILTSYATVHIPIFFAPGFMTLPWTHITILNFDGTQCSNSILGTSADPPWIRYSPNWTLKKSKKGQLYIFCHRRSRYSISKKVPTSETALGAVLYYFITSYYSISATGKSHKIIYINHRFTHTNSLYH